MKNDDFRICDNCDNYRESAGGCTQFCGCFVNEVVSQEYLAERFNGNAKKCFCFCDITKGQKLTEYETIFLQEYPAHKNQNSYPSFGRTPLAKIKKNLPILYKSFWKEALKYCGIAKIVVK